VVVVVVPALAEGEDRQPPVVARVVAGDVALIADDVGQGVDEESAVVEHRGAPEEADDQSRPAADREARDRQREPRNPVMAVEPAQLRVAHQVGDQAVVRVLLRAREDPAHVGEPEAPLTRRVDVELGVGVAVVLAVLGGPPQRSLLGRALGDERQHELERPAGLERPVREVAVVAGGDGEHPQQKKADGDGHGGAGDASPDRRQAGEVDQDERDRPGIDDVVVVFGCGRLVHEGSFQVR
jgi:hypothetical protein